MASYARLGSVSAGDSVFRLGFYLRVRRKSAVTTLAACTAFALTGCAGHHLSGGGSSSGGGSATASPTPSSGSGTIATIAGTALVSGYAGDGAAATSATLNDPTGLYVDGSGNLYIADHMNNVVRRVTPAGIISTFAGTGTAGYLGDGRQATSAELSGPQSIFGDSAGDIYIVESGNVGFSGGNVLRKVNSSGVISTVAGTGTAGYTGDGAAATTAQLSGPKGGCIDSSGNIYIADTGNNRIRKINTTGVISTYAGTGVSGYLGDGTSSLTAELATPTDIKTDSLGNFYIADKLNNRVRKVIGGGTFITTAAGSGTPPNNKAYLGDGALATLAELNLPAAIAVDSSNNFYIADVGNNAIRKVTVSSGIITTVAGNGTAGYVGDGAAATSAEIQTPGGVAVDGSGNLYIADSGNNVIRKVTY